MLSGLAVSGSSAGTTAPRVYFTAETVDGVPLDKPTRKFSCFDKIYAVIELEQLPRGRHTLLVRWFDRAGKQREQTEYDFQRHVGKQMVWAWLRIHRPRGGAVERMLSMDPAAGMEEFAGTWKVKIYIDNKKLPTTERIEIEC